MNLTFIGIGNVGSALADNLSKAGHSVSIACRDPQSDSVQAALRLNPSLRPLPVNEAVAGADVAFLATPYAANEVALKGIDFAGKVLVDCTNPVGPGLTHGLESKTSGAEEVQKAAPTARVVKAFTIDGYENFQDSRYPGYGGLKPAMLVAGDDAEAKTLVCGLCSELGWKPFDVGALSSSLHLEHMSLLWIKMARVQGKGPGFVWALLER